jgi:membrane associated rhomboid family serine protease
LYRILTAPFFHLNWVHILSNMSVFIDIGPALERRLGSFVFILLILMMVIASGITQEALAWVWTSVVDNYQRLEHVAKPGWISGLAAISRECSVGFSGVLFALLVIRVFEFSASEMIWILDIVPCPARLYPVVLLVLLQLFLPAVSLFGHLGGLLSGYSYVRGWIWPWVFKAIPRHFIQSVDDRFSVWIRFWAKHPEDNPFSNSSSNDRDPGMVATALQGFLDRWADTLRTRITTLRASTESFHMGTAPNTQYRVRNLNRNENADQNSRDVLIYGDENDNGAPTTIETLVRAGYDPSEASEALSVGGDSATARLLIDSRLSEQLREMGFDSIDIENALKSGCPKNVAAITEWIGSSAV